MVSFSSLQQGGDQKMAQVASKRVFRQDFQEQIDEIMTIILSKSVSVSVIYTLLTFHFFPVLF